MEMLIPSIPNATVDKQRIIRDLKRNRGTVSLALHSVSRVTEIKRARPTITPSAQITVSAADASLRCQFKETKE